MFTQNELQNILVLVKEGLKSATYDGRGLITVGMMITKIEGLIKTPEEKVEDTK